MEAATIVPNYTGTSVHLAQLFVNATACILAKTRCAEPNPITGARRDDSWKSTATYNALLVNSDYDINILHLPFSNLASDECQKYRNIETASWPTVKC